jgi:NAD(P)-dependent dehydrogenase (short-subunit alcohol dehydrogenase family)
VRDGGVTQRVAWKAFSYLNRPVSVRRAPREETIADKRILITGASSGVGRATAARLAGQGATVLLVARREQRLVKLRDEIVEAGGEAAHRACDLSSREEVDGLVRWVLDGYGGVDVLINNAGCSMRRPIVESLDRPEDFDRTMAVNYFGPVRLTMGLLSSMLERRYGHIVNVGTWTVPVATSPRFAAYHSSKAALAGFGRCVDAELAGEGVRVTAVHYPLVHTPMSAPTKRYRRMPGLSPEEAADWIVAAIGRRPVRIVPRTAILLAGLGAFVPRSVDRLLLRWG